ncbi:hypothetical protein OG417_48570 [Actinoallomurus sp. NBC_01490]|uniref:hypothetical protein n=1 Tax=Actinoallomurus sp. NBC_01490 TaxID=2903557 RepID=UPI002E338761|nr:hypothetical protein [Actinoallomurus sp. NBC_01490]
MPDAASTVRAGVRGLIAAMAMSGLRDFTANIGLLEKSPPEVIIERHAPKKVKRLATEHRSAIIELAHWAYGAAGGAAFGLLPCRLRANPYVGPVYGLVVWLGFELGIGPLLGVQYREQRRPAHRAMLAIDHMMYGTVVAGRLAPAPEVRP